MKILIARWPMGSSAGVLRRPTAEAFVKSIQDPFDARVGRDSRFARTGEQASYEQVLAAQWRLEEEIATFEPDVDTFRAMGEAGKLQAERTRATTSATFAERSVRL